MGVPGGRKHALGSEGAKGAPGGGGASWKAFAYSLSPRFAKTLLLLALIEREGGRDPLSALMGAIKTKRKGDCR